MDKSIAIVGAGAVGGYTGTRMARAGGDVTFIDPWPWHVEEIKRNGLRITHHQEPFTARPRPLHLTELRLNQGRVELSTNCAKALSRLVGVPVTMGVYLGICEARPHRPRRLAHLPWLHELRRV